MPDLDTIDDAPTSVTIIAPTLVEMTTELVAAYVTRNHVQTAELPGLIASVHTTLSDLGQATAPQPVVGPLVPAVPIKKSITDEFIISLEDGRKFRTLKRYLSTLGMTPDQYRAKWGLPATYPMVAPAFAAKRSVTSKAYWLGRQGEEAPLPEPDEVLEPAKVPEMRRPGKPD